MTRSDEPYGVERVQTPTGPRWRLAGPGLSSPTYPWEEFRDKLAEIAQVMNFAYQQGRMSGTPARPPVRRGGPA